MTANSSNLRVRSLAAGLSAAIALIAVEGHASANGVIGGFGNNILVVTSCADDNASGTLRHVVASAVAGDDIDLSGLTCAGSTINLTRGEIVIGQDVTLSGPLGGGLTIAGGGGRVLHSTSANLSIVNLNIRGGGVYTTDDDADGGCILAAGNVALSGAVVSNCVASSTHASAHGGAISAVAVSLVSSRISGSAATSTGFYQVARGGGVNAASLSCTDSTLSGNRVAADASNGYGQGGGALISDGDVDLSRCTFDSNTAGEGGAIMQFVNEGYSPMTRIQNSTISGNTATFTSGGIEVFCPDCSPQPVQILNSTLAFNSSPTAYGDGVVTNGSVIAQSSIIANNGPGDGSPFADIFAASVTGADNLIMAMNVKPGRGVVAVSGDPMLMPLADNGGPTRTHGLSDSSPAWQLGNNSAAFDTDQRGNGFERAANGMVDIGAYQHQATMTAIASRHPLPVKHVAGKK